MCLGFAGFFAFTQRIVTGQKRLCHRLVITRLRRTRAFGPNIFINFFNPNNCRTRKGSRFRLFKHRTGRNDFFRFFGLFFLFLFGLSSPIWTLAKLRMMSPCCRFFFGNLRFSGFFNRCINSSRFGGFGLLRGFGFSRNRRFRWFGNSRFVLRLLSFFSRFLDRFGLLLFALNANLLQVHPLCLLDRGRMLPFTEPFANRCGQAHRNRGHMILDLVQSFGLTFLNNGLAFDP